MKKHILFGLLLVLFLSSCSTNISANMYFVESFLSNSDESDTYIIIESYDSYSEFVGEINIKEYSREYFNDSSLIILELVSSNHGNNYKLTSIKKTNKTLNIKITEEKDGLGMAFSKNVYCIEIETKNINKINLEREN